MMFVEERVSKLEAQVKYLTAQLAKVATSNDSEHEDLISYRRAYEILGGKKGATNAALTRKLKPLIDANKLHVFGTGNSKLLDPKEVYEYRESQMISGKVR